MAQYLSEEDGMGWKCKTKSALERERKSENEVSVMGSFTLAD